MTLFRQNTTRSRLRVTALAVVAAALGCAGETSPSANRTALYIYAAYASPNITVSVNGQLIGTITQQYAGTTDCTVLVGKSAADGVLSVPVAGGVHYAINWTFSSGTADADSFDATPDYFQVPCLLEPIDPPAADVVGSSPLQREAPHRTRPGSAR